MGVMVVKEETIPPVVGGCAQDGVAACSDAIATATIVEGSEFSPRIRRILEAQPLSPLRRAVLSGPVGGAAVGPTEAQDRLAAATIASRANLSAEATAAEIHASMLAMGFKPCSTPTPVPLTYTPQMEEKVVVRQTSNPTQ